MGYLIDIYYDNNSLVITIFRILSIGVAGDSADEYYTTTLHLSLWKMELTTSLGWRKNGK